MDITLNIGNSVYSTENPEQYLGVITAQLGKETNNPTEETWFEVEDCGRVEHYPLSKLSPDLFEHYEQLPQEVQDILVTFGEAGTYKRCNTLLKKLKPHGYKFEYYLDAEPYHLHKINLVVSI